MLYLYMRFDVGISLSGKIVQHLNQLKVLLRSDLKDK